MGGRSRVAAQLLAGQGFAKVYNLKGGIAAWNGIKAAGPAEEGLHLISGRESPTEMLVVAYGLEEGLRGFYAAMAQRTDLSNLTALFARLAEIETHHKQKLYGLYRHLAADAPDQGDFETRVMGRAMEGGLTMEEFLGRNQPVLVTEPDVLNMAMTLEAQALDLYLRFSQTSRDNATKAILYDLGDDEKAHLKALGDLMDGVVG